MKSIFKAAMVSSVAAMSLGLAACDSAAENQMEDEATAIDEAAEAQADNMEAAGASEAAVEAVEEQGEETKDAMEEQADNMDAAPQ
ncbi:hypothetical protein GRI44_11725 [Altererythrobacter confluentis]|uniref:Uncharacterized protein n=1 Tax=Allopontixanthobacter confluentis TaxID=1849021 RepID=A0A6L7GHJ9_9SPHN|nr:hypothetical protein [Allopontixanthobacter confluentis]MXP15419.1 hypothetical protein [Allopontixanthobacter confluentis]